MQVGTATFRKGLNQARADLSSFSASVQGTFGQMAGLAAGLGVANFLNDAVKAASDLSEQSSKAGVVFGQFAGGVEAEAAKMADQFGYSRTLFLDAASSIGLIGKASGMTQKDAAALGSQFSRLAADMASFYNVPLEEALMALRSSLVGETEPMRRFGVLLSAGAVEAEALRLGIKGANGELTEGQKVQARVSLITKGLTDATGDLARTQDSVANQTRSLSGRFGDLLTTVGEVAQPIAQAFYVVANESLRYVGEWLGRNKQDAIDWAKGTVKSGGIINVAIGKVGDGLADAADTLVMMPVYWEEFKAAALAAIAETATGLNKFRKNWEDVQDSIRFFLVFVNQGGDAAFQDARIAAMQRRQQRNFNPADLEAKAEEARKKAAELRSKLPKPGEPIRDFFDELQKKLDKVASSGVGPSGGAAAPMLDAPAAAEGVRLAGAFERASADAQAAILRAREGGARNKPAEETASNTAEAVNQLRQLNQKLGGANPAAIVSIAF